MTVIGTRAHPSALPAAKRRSPAISNSKSRILAALAAAARH
jgi:hypothetical protein